MAKQVIVIFQPAETGGEWVVFCKGAGDSCVDVDTSIAAQEVNYFVAPAADGAAYDSDLANLTTKLNAMIHEAHTARKDKGKKLGLYLSPRGLMPVWKIETDELPRLAPESKVFHIEEMPSGDVESLFWPKRSKV